MSDDPITDDWLDDQFLEMDSSEKGWVSKSLGGMTKADALMGIPRRGQILVEHGIEPIRKLRARIKASNTTQGDWMRQAVAMRLAHEGAPEDEVKAWLK